MVFSFTDQASSAMLMVLIRFCFLHDTLFRGRCAHKIVPHAYCIPELYTECVSIEHILGVITVSIMWYT